MVQSGRWIRASSLGVAIGAPLGCFVYGLYLVSGIYFSFGDAYLIFGILLGLTIGVSQWFVLQQQVDGAGWWIIVVPGCFILGIFYFFLSNASPVVNAITVLAGVGCFTGILLSLLLQFPKLQRAGQ